MLTDNNTQSTQSHATTWEMLNAEHGPIDDLNEAESIFHTIELALTLPDDAEFESDDIRDILRTFRFARKRLMDGINKLEIATNIA